MIKRLLPLFLFLLPLSAQTVNWDATGNGLLSGQFRFREVFWQSEDENSQLLTEAISLRGIITFDGQGNYVINGQAFTRSTGQTESVDLAGTYTISASGLGFIRRSNPFGGVV